MLTVAEFDVLVRVAVLALAVVWALMLLVVQVVVYRRVCGDDLMAVPDAVYGPEMERIP